MLKIRVTGLPEEVEAFVKELALSDIGEVLNVSLPYKQNRKNHMSKYEATYVDFKLNEKESKLRTTVYYIVGRSMGEEPDEESHDVKVGPFMTTKEAHEEMYKMSEELTLAGQHIYSGLYIDSEEVYQ